MPKDQDFELLLKEKLNEGGITLKRLSELSGIALTHLESLCAGRYEELPPAPYLHGYLTKLGAILNFDAEAWWEKLKAEGAVRGAGREDQLPKNRFAREPITKQLWIGLAIAAVLLYFGLRFPAIFGKPAVSLSAPHEDMTTVTEPLFLVKGNMRGGDEVLVNGELATVLSDGSWEKQIMLEEGLNTLTVIGKKFLGRQTTIMKQLLYVPPAPLTPAGILPGTEAPATSSREKP